MKSDCNDITRLLERWRGGDESAQERLFELMYDDIHSLAQRYLASENRTITLQSTDLVNEAYLRLMGQSASGWQNRRHFLAIATTLVRRIVIDHIRGKKRAKRGGQTIIVSLQTAGDAAGAVSGIQVDWLSLDRVLDRLESQDSLSAEIVKLRYFAGLNIEEVAKVMEMSISTVTRNWRFTRAWLHQQLAEDG